MRSRQFLLIGVAALLGIAAVPMAQATPVVVPSLVANDIAPHGSIQQVYYYRHHHYRYRWHGHYYNHRRHSHGRWNYY